ncbi:MAG: hypothetical protein ACYCTG_11795, partial [Ferrimicrobium sp.]
MKRVDALAPGPLSAPLERAPDPIGGSAAWHSWGTGANDQKRRVLYAQGRNTSLSASRQLCALFPSQR